MRALEIQPCQNVCTWSRSVVEGEGQAELDGLPVFVCGGCGSEWVRSEAWTPIGADGIVPASVAAEAALRRPAPGTADERVATSDPSADAAGSAGS